MGSTGAASRLFRVPVVTRPGTVALRTRAPRRPIVIPSRADNQVWQPRFAYTAAIVVLVGFVVVALPLWLALYRTVGTPGVQLSHVLPLSMMLLGGFLTAVTAWVVIVEMRARVRLVDTVGRTGDHEAPGAAGISAYTGLLRPFAQVPAQVALLAVALALFVGATILAF
jgi:hypothetical protein